MPERLAEEDLPLVDGVEHPGGLAPRVRAHVGLLGVPAEPEGNHAHARQRRVAVQDPGQGVLERGAVVDARAEDDLAVDLDAAVEQHLQPAQAGRPLRVAQHACAELGVGGVDGDEERAEALGEDALRIELGEAGRAW